MNKFLSNNLIKIVILFFLIIGFSFKNNNQYPWFNGDYELAKTVAGNRLIMLDFYSDWWGACNRLDAEVFKNSQVIELSKEFISLKLDVNIDQNHILSNMYNVSNIPQNIFVDKNGNEVGRIVGFYPSDVFIEKVEKILSSY